MNLNPFGGHVNLTAQGAGCAHTVGGERYEAISNLGLEGMLGLSLA